MDEADARRLVEALGTEEEWEEAERLNANLFTQYVLPANTPVLPRDTFLDDPGRYGIRAIRTERGYLRLVTAVLDESGQVIGVLHPLAAGINPCGEE